jgi:hypothetical protein
MFLLTYVHNERELHFQKHNLFNNNPSQFLCLEKKPDLDKGVSNEMVVARVHKYFFMIFICFISVF